MSEPVSPSLQPAAALLRGAQRHLVAHPVQTLLAVLAVALGVALAVGIDLANGSATRAFTYATQGVAGRATHQLTGGEGTVPDTLPAHLRIRLGLSAAAPIVERPVRAALTDTTGETLRLMGVDALSEAPFRPYLAEGNTSARGATGFPLAEVLTRPNAVVLSTLTAQRLGLRLRDSLTLEVEGRARRVGIVGLLDPTDGLSRRSLDGLLIADLATAQELTGLVGRLSRVELVLDSAAAARLAPSLPPSLRLERAAARTERLEQMSAAFRLNLRALSLLALVVAVLLIYNTTTFAVLRRWRWLGLMRALGTSRRALVLLVLGEAAAIGLLGASLGLLLGAWLAQVLTGLIARSLNDLYFAVTVSDVELAPASLLLALALGVGGAVLGALAPALEAARVPPRGALLRSSVERRRPVQRLVLAGAFAVAGFGLMLFREELAAAYLGLLLLIGAVALLTPLLVVALMRMLAPVAGRLVGVLGRLAARDVEAALSRTGVAVAALAVAVAATVGVGVMVTSFRSTVVTWLGSVLDADVFISPPATVSRFNDGTLDSAVVARVAAHPLVAELGRIRSRELLLEGRPITLVASRVPDRTRSSYRFLQGDSASAWAAFDRGAAFVSEPLARRFGRWVGDSLMLPLPGAARPLLIAAVYYDYGSDLGLVLLHDSTYRRLSPDRGVSGLAAYAVPSVSADSLARVLRAATAPLGQRLFVRSNRALLEQSLIVFDRTFAVTDALWLLTVLVAFVGVLSALLALELERGRELAVLRAGGLTPGQLFVLMTSHTALLGLAAGLIALPLGLGLAWALVNVINLRSFGWTLQFEVPALLLVQAVGFAVLAAVLAGLWPAWRMGRTSVALSLRDE